MACISFALAVHCISRGCTSCYLYLWSSAHLLVCRFSAVRACNVMTSFVYLARGVRRGSRDSHRCGHARYVSPVSSDRKLLFR
ncbi:hypothetical protein C8T65DRAFT_141820 [Cerioporus squamosus]|nr:hypothetical protein C8T65DRAFT_141820 [Cerioporus squamosus]